MPANPAMAEAARLAEAGMDRFRAALRQKAAKRLAREAAGLPPPLVNEAVAEAARLAETNMGPCRTALARRARRRAVEAAHARDPGT